eukprot:TRINITY_DN64901_c0_g1_i1.p2 TRINITY_DN64901_c0_g1~~TRINITY_DN64901_c0_g1_i1.p2  ORF type:complete len:158 (+),score=49.43 TRINITY_DN64901_c0_g1_i1:88-561(+)
MPRAVGEGRGGALLDPGELGEADARCMMEYDSKLRCSAEIQAYYDECGLGTAKPEDRAQRLTLEHFGYAPTDANLERYRSGVIAKWRQQGWRDGWDVAYIKGNHLLAPGRADVRCGDNAPDAPLLRAGDLGATSVAELQRAAGAQGRHLVVACGSAT